MIAAYRTPEQAAALRHLQDKIAPHVGGLLDEAAAMLDDVPDDHLDVEINNTGHLLMLVFKKTAPHLSDAVHYSLPFAFAELLRERMSSRWHRKAII